MLFCVIINANGFMKKKVLLLKDLPSCPARRIFKEDIKGDFYLEMTDQEAVENKLKQYRFTKEEILANEEFFYFIH